MLKKSFLRALALSAAILFAHPCQAADLDGLLKKFDAQWEKTNDYQVLLSVFFNYSENIAKRFKDLDPYNEGAHWNYVVFQYTHKKPGLNHFRMMNARNIGEDYISKLLEDNPGTRIINGWDPKTKKPVADEFIYVRMDPRDQSDPSKAAMARAYYHVPENLTTSWIEKMSFRDTVQTIYRRKFDRFKKAGDIKIENVNFDYKTDLSVKDGKVNFTSVPYGAAIKIAFSPSDPNKNDGIDKEYVYIDPKTYFPLQFEAWEKNNLTACFVVQDLRLNVGVKEQLWENFFKGASPVDVMDAVKSQQGKK